MGEPYSSFASNLLCDSAIIGTWPRTTEPIQPHTAVQATDCGWCWKTEHESFIACGHAFSSAHLNPDEAEKTLRYRYPNATGARLFRLKQGRQESCWVNNVVGIGSAAAFVEPLASAGPAVLAFQCQWLAQSLVDCDRVLRPTLVRQFNRRWRRLVDGEREFLGLFYRYNTRLDPPSGAMPAVPRTWEASKKSSAATRKSDPTPSIAIFSWARMIQLAWKDISAC